MLIKSKGFRLVMKTYSLLLLSDTANVPNCDIYVNQRISCKHQIVTEIMFKTINFFIPIFKILLHFIERE